MPSHQLLHELGIQVDRRTNRIHEDILLICIPDATRDRHRAQAELECVLFDEPTTSLDPISARRVDRLIRDLSDRLKVAWRTLEIEAPEQVAARIRTVLRHIGPERVTLTTDCGMKQLPRGCAQQKLRALVAGAAIVRRELAGLEVDHGD